MALRDYFVAPADAAHAREAPAGARRRFGVRPRPGAGAAASRGVASSLGVLAASRDLPAVAAAAGLVMARRAPVALACLYAPGTDPPAPAWRAPARSAATRLAESLTARGIAAEARGRLVVANVGVGDDRAQRAGAAGRALAAAGAQPSVLAVAVRDADIDALLAARDAMLVALAPSADPALAELTLAGASDLTRSTVAVTLSFDPVSRALALAGLRAPGAVAEAVEGVLG